MLSLAPWVNKFLIWLVHLKFPKKKKKMGNSFYFWTNVAFSHFSIAWTQEMKELFYYWQLKLINFNLTKQNSAELEN